MESTSQVNSTTNAFKIIKPKHNCAKKKLAYNYMWMIRDVICYTINNQANYHPIKLFKILNSTEGV
ncbi:hypothetical protein Hdeb2414_s0006g00190341 [Helianthus debilis subsp. tardiflorus]